MIQHPHTWAYIQRKPYQEKVNADQRSLQHYLQQPGHGSNLNVHQHCPCGIYTWWNITQPLKKETMPSKGTWMDLEIIILREVSPTDKGKCHISSLTCGILEKKYKWTYLQDRVTLLSVYMSIPISQFIPPLLSPLVTLKLFFTSVTLSCK